MKIKAIESGLYYSKDFRSLSIPYEDCSGNWYKVLILVLTVKINLNKRYNLVRKLKRKGCCRTEKAIRYILREDWYKQGVELEYEDLLGIIPSDMAEEIRKIKELRI